jgi:hypothetical protein
MTDEKKPLKIEFAPGCFDKFEGTQEELDEFIKEIKTMFTELTPEELEARSRPISIDDLLEDESISDDDFENILQALVDSDKANKRKLQ